MTGTRTRKGFYNIVCLATYQVVALVCGLILPRLIIRTYGSEYNGMIASITQFLSFVSILRLGVAGSSRAALYAPLAQGDNNKVSRIIKATDTYMRRIGYIIVAYIVVLCVLYPLLVKSQYSFLNISLLVIAIGIGTFSQYFFGLTYQTLLAADQRLYVYNILQTVTVILNTIISVVIIKLGGSIQFMKFMSAILFFANPYILYRYVKKSYGLDLKCEPDNTALEKRKDAMGHSIANIIHDNTDTIVLTLFCGVKIVSVYSVYNLVMAGLKSVLNVFTEGAEAVIGNMWAKKEEETLEKNFNCFEYLISAFVSIVFSVAALLILPFISLYTKDVSDVEYIIPVYAVVVILANVAYCIRTPYLAIVQGAGMYKETKKGAYAEAAINLVSSVILVQFIGIIGVAIGTLLANVFRTLQYVIFTSKYLIKRKWTYIFKNILFIMFNSVLIIVPCLFFCSYSYESWANWILMGIIFSVFAVIITLITSYIFYKSNLLLFFNILNRMLGRKGKKG